MSREAVTFARTLAERTGGPVHAVVVGDRPDGLVDQLGSYGVAEVHHATGDAVAAYGGAAWAAAVQTAVAAVDADVVLAPGTPRGMEVAAHLAARLDVPMAANVVGIEGAGEGPPKAQSRCGSPARSWAVRCSRRWCCPSAPPCSRSRGTPSWTSPAFRAPRRCASSRRRSPRRTWWRGWCRWSPSQSSTCRALLTSARVVVGAGRGAGSAAGFDSAAELAELLGGALGVSRVVTSLGWRPHHEQIGQTGSRISPDVYIPCGISGAIQHWAGCASSKTILAINTDENAPMVTKATYAVIGDMHEVVPAINAELRRRRG